MVEKNYDAATLGLRHDNDRWEIIHPPTVERTVQQRFWSGIKSATRHRVYREVWQVTNSGIRKRRFERKTGQEMDSSSSNSSSSSASSSSTAASVTSSSSSGHSSSSSSSGHSSSSSTDSSSS